MGYGLAVYLAISLTRNSTSVAAIWPANAVLLAGLLGCRVRSSRAILLAAGFAANALATVANGDPWTIVATFPLIGVGESLLAYMSLRYVFGKRVALTNATKVSMLESFVR